MSPLRSTRMGLLPPCKDLCCSSASPFYHLAFFPLCLRFSDFAHSRYLRLRQVSSLTAGIFVYSRYLRLRQVSSFTAGIFVYGRYLRLRQVSVFALTVGRFVFARSKVRPRTGTKNIRAYCLLAGGPHHYSGRWSSGCFGFTWGLVEFRKMLWRLPPIHFGRADGVECTLLRVACQSETFLAPPWQGGAILHASVAHWLPK